MTEAKRFDMHRELKRALGDDVANTMMEHLPPTGWADVARKDDIDAVRRDIEKVDKRLSITISVGIAFGLALLALQVQIMLSIANL